MDLTIDSLYNGNTIDSAFIINLIARKELLFDDYKGRIIGYDYNNYPFLFLPGDWLTIKTPVDNYNGKVIEINHKADIYILFEVDVLRGKNIHELSLRPQNPVDENLHYRWVSLQNIELFDFLKLEV